MLTSRQINAERKKEGKPPLNFALFRKVIKKLETAPEAYDQETYGRKEQDAPCGTAACIAGWACMLSGEIRPAQIAKLNDKAEVIARRVLGLAGNEIGLFAPLPDSSWPRQFRDAWRNARGETERSRVAIRYLKRILKTGKVLE